MNVFFQICVVLFSVVLLAGCDGKKNPKTVKNVSGANGGKVDQLSLEKKLEDFKPEVILKGVKPLAGLDVARLTNEFSLIMDRDSLPVSSGVDGYACNFKGHSLAAFLAEYSRLTGKTVIQEVDEPEDGVTFKMEEVLPVEEAMLVMEMFLAEKMNVALLPDDAGDIKAVRRKTDTR